MSNSNPSPLALLLLLAAPLFTSGAPGDVPQNVCGSAWSDAIKCEARCPGGANSECPSGKQCYSDVPCPVPPTISPKPTRQPVRAFPVGNHNKQIIGYYASWQWYDRGKVAKPVNIDFGKMTRVNFAFFQLDEDGNIWGTDEWADPRLLFGDVKPESENCSPSPWGRCKCHWHSPSGQMCNEHDEATGLIYLAHQARVEIYPSIGGWTLSDAFPGMAADTTNRAIFARNCRRLIEAYDFDGIDLDWEYPGYASHSGTPQDTVNFNLLLRDIRAELDALGAQTGKFYGITAALPCGPSNINNIDIQTVAQYLTEFNLMSYDFHGSWDATTGVNSPLFDQANDPEPGWSVDGCVKNWVARGAPKDKLNIGLAFYGRSYMGAKQLGVAHGGTDEFSWEADEGTPQYFNIMDQIDSLTIHWDEETSTPYAFFNDVKGGLISFDDERAICLKTEYAIEENLHGFIIWELSGDMMEDFYSPLLNIINRKLSETNTNCADPFGARLPTPTVPIFYPPPAAQIVPDTPAEPIVYNPPAVPIVPAYPVQEPENDGGVVGPGAMLPAASANNGVVVGPGAMLPANTPPDTTTEATTTTTEATTTTTEEATTTTDATTTTTEATTTTSTTSTTTEEDTTTSTTFMTTTTTTEEEPTTTSTSTSTTTTTTMKTAAKIEAAMNSFTPDVGERKRVQRVNNKPDKPYRPPKEIRVEL